MNHIIATSVLAVSIGMACLSCTRGPVVPEGMTRIELPRCETGAATDVCSIRVFDGAAMFPVQGTAGEHPYIEVETETAMAARIAVYTAPNHVPRVQAVRAVNAGAPEPVRLTPARDARGGYLAGVVFRKSEQQVDGSVCSIESFMADRHVVINRARARFETTTDNLGSFVVALPAGRYMVHVEGEQRAVDVPRGDTHWIAFAVP